MGCKERLLAKYYSWYESRNFETITFIPPAITLFIPSKAETQCEDLNEILSTLSQNDPTRKYIFHTFSGNGFHFYVHSMMKLSAKHSDIIDKIQGIIIDSAPPKPDFEVFVNGVVSTLATTIFKAKSETAHNHWLLRPIIKVLIRLYLLLPVGKNNMSKLREFMFSKQQPKFPQLYLYSDIDRVCPAEHIEEFMRNQKAHGIRTESYKFIGSPHVSHGKVFPDQYWNTITTFLSSLNIKINK